MKKKNFEIKKKHHYVWAQYLKQWATENNIWYVSSKNNISNDSVYGLSQQKEFYKMNALDSDDIAFIKMFPETDSPTVRKFHDLQLQHFILASSMINTPLKLVNIEDHQEVIQISKWAENNSLENTHTIIESLARPILNDLWSGNPGILNNKHNMVNFCNYIAQQLARTNKLKTAIMESLKNQITVSRDVEKTNQLFEKNWWFISYKMGINFGHGLVQNLDKDTHTFIKNNTCIDFITTDVPIINIHESALTGSTETEIKNLDLYYPLSPKYAYIISDSKSYEHLQNSIDEESVKRLNLLMASKAHKNIYGSSKSALTNLKNKYQ
ncbi:hypothetical protein A7318_19950 [Pseudomonas lurida]|uniref:DUF4238 domain-containing protein n=1 Tax=Pseudomonas lurida TaxID=244566 RepID=UPI00083D0A2C|nr:DUF4238 domain-containing protein [Pseudomonas lurida]AOE80766.1 hypothetical protein A7318_19950 [Pseudomonas lurida]